MRAAELDEDASVSCAASPGSTEHFSAFQLQFPGLSCCSGEGDTGGVAFSQGESTKRHKKLALGWKSNSVNALHRDRRGKPAPPLRVSSSARD